jgi:multiple antibiotic resistance protein
MTDFTRVAVALFAVLNTPGVIRAFAALAPTDASGRTRFVGTVLGLTFASLAVVAIVSDPVLDWLDISPENFQVAAGIVMLVLALRLLWSGELGAPNLRSPYWGALSLVLGPVPVVAILGYATRYGIGTSIGAAVVAVVVSAVVLMTSRWLGKALRAPGRSVLARCNGALIVLLAIQLIVDGIQSV